MPDTGDAVQLLEGVTNVPPQLMSHTPMSDLFSLLGSVSAKLGRWSQNIKAGSPTSCYAV
jgi:hypothetical protein